MDNANSSDNTSAASAPAANTRQKRVLPSRSRRGGPGVGSCDVDVMILETQKRKLENEPLIPAETQLLLATNSAVYAGQSPSASTANLNLNLFANYRYFDRPEVLKAYREQQLIETPEFVNIADNPSVASRFRPRGSEDDIIDTSDAAYEKRHRKYETFEKRQRLREKEKLKHEQYKLKERIDQLRTMDASAFLSLPTTAFPANPTGSQDGAELIPTSGVVEGERRRREMLDVAFMLEERYRVLLPPERLRKQSTYPTAAMTPSIASDASVHDETPQHETKSEKEPDSEREEPTIEPPAKEGEKIKLKIRFPARVSSAASSTSATRAERSPTRKSKSRPQSIPTSPVAVTRRTRGSLNHTLQTPEPEQLHTAPISSLPMPDPSISVLTTLKSPPEPISSTTTSERVSYRNASIVSIIPTIARESSPSSQCQGSSGSPDSHTSVHQNEQAEPSGAPASTTSIPEVETYKLLSDVVQPVATLPRPRKRMKAAIIPPAPSPGSPTVGPMATENPLLRSRPPSIPPIGSILTPNPVSAPTKALSRHSSTPRQLSNMEASVAPSERAIPCQLLLTAIRNSKARANPRPVNAFGVKVPALVSETRDFELPGWLLAASGPKYVPQEAISAVISDHMSIVSQGATELPLAQSSYDLAKVMDSS